MTTINQNRRRINTALDPSPILQTAFGFWHSKVLLTAVEMGLFTKLANHRLTGAELGAELKLHPRAIADFFDALVAMKFLGREGDGPQARYFNTPEGSLFLDEASPRYIGGWLAMCNARLFKFWNDLLRRCGRAERRTRSSMARRACLKNFMRIYPGWSNSWAR